MKPTPEKTRQKMAESTPVKAAPKGTKSGRPKTVEDAPAPGEEAAP